MVCRACLSSDVDDMINIDDKCIENYNLLTNLNISDKDGMPQDLCMECWLLIHKFVEFRDKCIASDSSLRETIKSDVKIETKLECIKDETNIIKDEPIEVEIDSAQFLACIAEASQFNTDCSNYSDDDIEWKKSKKIKKSKKNHSKRKLKKKQPNDKEDSEVTVKVEPEINVRSEEVIIGDRDEAITCGLCPKTFDDKALLLGHLDGHKSDITCQYCFECFVDRPHILSHRLRHLPLNKANCPICWKKFRRDFYLEYHIRKIHCDDEYEGLKCKVCLKMFEKPHSLIKHVNRSHRDPKRYDCPQCTKLFQTKQLLKSHLRVHSSEKKFVCDTCGYSCRYPGSLHAHKLRKHTVEKFQCTRCSRFFVREEKMLSHKCRTLMCAACGKEFKQHNMYSRHLRTHTDECRYKCTRCPAKYKTREALKVHNDRHDGNRTRECEYCHAKFYSYPVLLKHKRIHTGEKPYVCKVCFKGFTGRHNLKVHMKVHGEMLVVKKDQDVDKNI